MNEQTALKDTMQTNQSVVNAADAGMQLPAAQESAQNSASAFSLVMDDGAMERMMSAAKLMASAKVTIPAHLRDNPGDCMAVIMQAAQWQMNPFAVAQKTHLVNGTLGYEAQLVHAVLQSTKAIRSTFNYEYTGSGTDLACRVGAVLRGDTEVTWGEWLNSSSVTTKNSPLWKTNPEQQLGYLQVKNWARKYAPGAILGVYTVDELEDSPPMEKNITPGRQNGKQIAAAAQSVNVSDDQKSERAKLIKAMEEVAHEYGLEAYAEQWSKLTPEQRKMIGAEEHERIKKAAAEFIDGDGVIHD